MPTHSETAASVWGYWYVVVQHARAIYLEGGRRKEGGGGRMTCEPWPKWKKETALTQLLVDGDVDGADLGPVPHMHTVDCLFWSTLFNHTTQPQCK